MNNGNPSAFNLLRPEIQRVLFEKGWTSLRPIQEASIPAYLKDLRDLLIVAGTAGGKTEAWLLPVLSQLIANLLPSIQVICVSPLKALINDQYGRLVDLAKGLHVPVHRHHGDVGQNHKDAWRKNPRGILIITPESLEAMLLKRSSEVPRVFKHLQLVVIDEVHAMLETERGVHLQSLLSRISNLIGHRPRMIGLSATIAL